MEKLRKKDFKKMILDILENYSHHVRVYFAYPQNYLERTLSFVIEEKGKNFLKSKIEIEVHKKMQIKDEINVKEVKEVIKKSRKYRIGIAFRVIKADSYKNKYLGVLFWKYILLKGMPTLFIKEFNYAFLVVTNNTEIYHLTTTEALIEAI